MKKLLLHFLLVISLGTAGNSLFASDKATKKNDAILEIGLMAKGLHDYDIQLQTAIAQKDDAKIATMMKDPIFTLLANANPGGVFLIAEISHNYKVLDAFLAAGADINTPIFQRGTLLDHAVFKDDVKMVNYLLDRGSDAFLDVGRYRTAVERVVSLKPKNPATDSVMAVLQHVKNVGMLDTYLRWEKMLSELRSRGQDANGAAKEKGYFVEIQKLAGQIKN